jgi:hypothetical protein
LGLFLDGGTKQMKRMAVFYGFCQVGALLDWVFLDGGMKQMKCMAMFSGFCQVCALFD